jgi:hypothetical protein
VVGALSPGVIESIRHAPPPRRGIRRPAERQKTESKAVGKGALGLVVGQ